MAGGSVTELPRPETWGKKIPGLWSGSRVVSMDCNKFSSLGLATSDVARPLAPTHTLQIGSHPVCAGAQGLLPAERRKRLCRALGWCNCSCQPCACSCGMPGTGGGWMHSGGCGGAVTPVGTEFQACGQRSTGLTSALTPDTNPPPCGWFLDPVQHFVCLAGTGGLWNCSFLTWMGDEMMRMTTVLEGGI